MENTLYRLITSTEDPAIKEKEICFDFLDYEDALTSYNKEIEFKTSSNNIAGRITENYLLIQNDYESNASGQWHRCNLKSEKGSVFMMRIEPIQFFEAEYFATEDIKARYNAIYGISDNSSNFFTRLFKWKK